MKQNRKFIPMIALGLTALLGVSSAEIDWVGNTLSLTEANPTFSSTEARELGFLDDAIIRVSIQEPSIIARYNQPLSVKGGALTVVFNSIGTELEIGNSLTLENGQVKVYLSPNYLNLGGDNIFSASQGVVLNGGDLSVDVRNSTSSDFNSDITFRGGNANFDFSNFNNTSNTYGFGGVGIGRMLKFDTTTTNGKAIFNFYNSNNVNFGFRSPIDIYKAPQRNTEDVLLNFSGSNNTVSFFTEFSNLKIVFGADRNINSSNNTFIRNHTALQSVDDDPNIAYIRWIQNDATEGQNNSVVSFPNKDRIGHKLIIGGTDDTTNTGVRGASVNFVMGVNTASPYGLKKDTLVIHAGSGTHNLGVKVFGSDDFQASTPTSLLIASAVNNVKLNTIDGYVNGFTLSKVEYNIVESTDENGNVVEDNAGNYTSYFLTSAKNVGVAPVNQSITSSALALNYDLFIGNFNSLNKRMGELRDNPYSQGAWARVFNGQISNDFSGSKNNYTTIQMGYDHKLGELSDASNYLGFSVSYLLGLSDQHSIDASSSYLSRSIKDVISNGIEIALYNSYIQDSGWFSDTIAKFSYLTSDFNILDNSNSTSEKESTSNIAFTLSQEFGYRFKLGETQSWYIDPQAELALGYFSGTDLKQVAGSDYLDAKSDSMILFRARVGTAVGYDFKDLTSSKDFNAKLYVGLSYEADFVSGGDVTLTPNNGSATKVGSLFGSDGRGVLNVGTNLEIKEYIRMYADIQTSFGGKITNDYQVNFGVRYSFGEGAGKETPKPNSL